MFSTALAPRRFAASLRMLAGWLVVASGALAAGPPVRFTTDIAPVLATKCLTCHNAKKSKGGYRLESYRDLLKAGDSGKPPVAAGRADQSHLLNLLTTADADDRMPSGDDPLPAAQIELIRRWIQEGAKFDGDDATAPLSSLAAASAYPLAPATYPQPMPVTALAFGPAGRELFAAGYHELTVWDVDTGKLLRRLQRLPERIQAVAWLARDGSLAVAGGQPGRHGDVVILRPDTGQIVKRLGPFAEVVTALTATTAGDRLAAGGADNLIHLFDTASWDRLKTWNQHADWVLDLAFSANGRLLASASRDRTARVRNLETGRLVHTYADHSAPVWAVALDPAGGAGFSAGQDRRVHRWEFKEQGAQSGSKPVRVEGLRVECQRLAMGGAGVFAAGIDGRVRKLGEDGKSVEFTLGELPARPQSLATHAGRGLLAAGCHDGTVVIWETKTRQEKTRFVARP